MASLLDFLQQGSPAAPDEVSGAIAGTLASDPSRLAYGGPLGQTLGQISGGFYQTQAQAAAQRIADMHTAALPALSRAYATNDPVATIANDPDAPAYAKYMMFNQTPQEVADARLRFVMGATQRALLPKAVATGQAAAGGSPGALPTLGGPGAPLASPGGRPGAAPGLPATDPVDQAAAQMPPPGPARTQYLNGLPPAVRRGLLLRLPRTPAMATGPAPAVPQAAPATPLAAGPTGGGFGGTAI